MAKVVFLMSDYGHDPTETAVPYTAFKAAGFNISFATEAGKAPRCDSKMLEGLTQILLGASRSVVKLYGTMAASEEWTHPLSWSSPDFSLDGFDLVFLPGGHEKSVSQVIDSEAVHRLIVDYFPKTKKPGKKAIAAVCHGVMVLSESKKEDGKSVLHGCVTTSLPARFEQVAFWGTRVVLGDYYKTYGACSDDVEVSVAKALASPSDFKNSLGPSPFVVEDENYNYISARFPGDAELQAKKIVELMGKILSPEAAA